MCSTIRRNLQAPAGTFSSSRSLCYTCSFLNAAISISGPNSNFVTRDIFRCTSSNIIYWKKCSKCWNLTSVKMVDIYLTSLLNVITRFTDINDCVISPISGGNDSRKSRMINLLLHLIMHLLLFLSLDFVSLTF